MGDFQRGSVFVAEKQRAQVVGGVQGEVGRVSEVRDAKGFGFSFSG
jgi:hypothetical protein